MESVVFSQPIGFRQELFFEFVSDVVKASLKPGISSRVIRFIATSTNTNTGVIIRISLKMITRIHLRFSFFAVFKLAHPLTGGSTSHETHFLTDIFSH